MRIINTYPKGFDFNKEIILNNECYYVIPLMYKNPSSTTDYIQLVKKDCEDETYMLKRKDLQKHKDRDMSVPFIYTHKIGSDIAELLNLKTQKCDIVEYEGWEYLLLKDIQGHSDIKIMEPFSYTYPNLISEEKDIFKIYEELRKDEGMKILTPLSHVLVFDLLIDNNKRNARSYRTLYKKDGSRVHEYLIENQFGSYSLSDSEYKDKPYDLNYLKKFIKTYNFEDEYASFTNFVFSRKIILLDSVGDSYFLNNREKDIFLSIINKNIQKLRYLSKIL